MARLELLSELELLSRLELLSELELVIADEELVTGALLGAALDDDAGILMGVLLELSAVLLTELNVASLLLASSLLEDSLREDSLLMLLTA
jgi:hypothetical protein